MLERCPPGSNLCRASGQAFCVTHEADHPMVKRLLAEGEPVQDVWP